MLYILMIHYILLYTHISHWIFFKKRWWFATSALNFYLHMKSMFQILCMKTALCKRKQQNVIKTLPFPFFSFHFNCAVLQGFLSYLTKDECSKATDNNVDCSGTSSSRVIQYTLRVQRGLIALQNGYLFFMTQFPLGMPNISLQWQKPCKWEAHFINWKKIYWFYITKNEKEHILPPIPWKIRHTRCVTGK